MRYKTHYAQNAITACGRDIISSPKLPMIQHTTLPENVTCKKCQAVTKDPKKLKKYEK